MRTALCHWRTGLVGLALRGGVTAIGLLCVALLTTTVASAQSADLAVTQTAAPNPVAAASIVTATITVTNNGPNAAANVALVNLFPPDTSTTGPGTTPAGWSCVTAINSRQCTIPSLAAGASASFNPSFAASSQTPAGQVLVNDAIVTSTTVDPNLTNNLATTNTTINSGGAAPQRADLAVTKTGPASVASGETITYTIVLTNNGPNAAAVPSMNEATPPGTTFLSLVSPPGWTCDTPAVGGVGLVQCSLPSPPGPLVVGATATFTLTVQALAGTPSSTTTTNVVVVEQSPGNIDPTLTNNRATLNTLIRIPGDINGDSFVDIRDYGVWRASFGATNCGNRADQNGDCLVDIRDYAIWGQHFGEGTPADRRGSGPLPVGSAPAPRSTPGPALVAGDPATEASRRLLQADGSGLAVPLIPLVGGLLGLGGLAGWRRRRPPGRE